MEEIVNCEAKEEEKGPGYQKFCEDRFSDFLKPTPSNDGFLKFDSVRSSSFSFGRWSRSQIIDINSNPSVHDPTPNTNSGGRCFHMPFIGKIKWESLFTYCKKWIKHPMNISLIIWLFFVAACLVALFLLMTGLLNHTIRKDSDRKKWTEILNQILNALFTIMCLYQHPRISHHLVLLCRYRSKDILELRSIYCKNGRRKPHERAHLMFVIILLHITCWSQYGLCALYWAFTSKTRPDWPQILFIALGTGAPIVAYVYTVFGPLGRKNDDSGNDEELQRNYEAAGSVENELKVYDKKERVGSPEWAGGGFDCWDDKSVFWLSFFCTFCVFGWNMERLGFGNMYVHIITFILLCCAPFIVFSVAALNIYNETVRYLVGIAGITLCLLGLLYGGFWRIQMRRKFKLPGNGFCCGFLALTDFIQWLFCWSCSLAQEVRTGNSYDVENDGFCKKECELGSERVLSSLSGENVAADVIITLRSGSEAGSQRAPEEGVDVEMIAGSRDEEDEVVRNEMMRPPVLQRPPVLHSLTKEDDEGNVI